MLVEAVGVAAEARSLLDCPGRLRRGVARLAGAKVAVFREAAQQRLALVLVHRLARRTNEVGDGQLVVVALLRAIGWRAPRGRR
eukprot:2983952-Alexandrium_andersonii.AAC.1